MVPLPQKHVFPESLTEQRCLRQGLLSAALSGLEILDWLLGNYSVFSLMGECSWHKTTKITQHNKQVQYSTESSQWVSCYSVFWRLLDVHFIQYPHVLFEVWYMLIFTNGQEITCRNPLTFPMPEIPLVLALIWNSVVLRKSTVSVRFLYTNFFLH